MIGQFSKIACRNGTAALAPRATTARVFARANSAAAPAAAPRAAAAHVISESAKPSPFAPRAAQLANPSAATSLYIPPEEFAPVVQKAREFFQARGMVEVHTQNRLSILAACEDPFNVATYNYEGEVWPLPQTGQMWLEYELLTRPNAKGYYCVSTSYRAEPNRVPGRHFSIFPMIEFELPGGEPELRELLYDMLAHFGVEKIGRGDFDQVKSVETDDVDHACEEGLYADKGYPAFLVERFPESSHPFWNMKRTADGKHAHKIDVIWGGQETIGSAERSTDVEQMRNSFYTVEDGAYAELLFKLFGRERVERELEDFLALPMFPRFGGGIGVTRLIQAINRCKNDGYIQ